MTHNSEDEDEKSLFQKHMRGVTPLKNRVKVPHFTEKPSSTRNPKVVSQPVIASAQTPFLSDPCTLDVRAEDTLNYHAPGLVKPFKKLKQGTVSLDARLDLHGLYIDAARDALSRFILTAFARGLRYLLVIHGKGGQQTDMAILKSHVAHWLKQFPQIIAFHSAQPKDGGTGATYLLLKKHRGLEP